MCHEKLFNCDEHMTTTYGIGMCGAALSFSKHLDLRKTLPTGNKSGNGTCAGLMGMRRWVGTCRAGGQNCKDPETWKLCSPDAHNRPWGVRHLGIAEGSCLCCMSAGRAACIPQAPIGWRQVLLEVTRMQRVKWHAGSSADCAPPPYCPQLPSHWVTSSWG
jgi:hypothetical protein